MVGLIAPDRSCGPRAEQAIDGSRMIAQPVQPVLHFGNDRAAVCPMAPMSAPRMRAFVVTPFDDRAAGAMMGRRVGILRAPEATGICWKCAKLACLHAKAGATEAGYLTRKLAELVRLRAKVRLAKSASLTRK